MIGRNIFALACLSAIIAANKRIWSPYTWMRDKEDQKLTQSIKEFFTIAKEKDENEETDEDSLITPLGDNRVKMLDDTLVSDYVTVNYWMWEPIECDPDKPEMYCDSEEDIEAYQQDWEDADKLYFIMAESRSDPANDPLIIWLQGGPGCSSMLGLYTENGPFNFKFNKSNIKDPFELEYNEFSWNNNANVMYVD